MADIWGPLLGALFEVSKKKRMRARKLVKRAVKIAVEKSTFPEESSKRLKKSLKKLLNRRAQPEILCHCQLLHLNTFFLLF